MIKGYICFAGGERVPPAPLGWYLSPNRVFPPPTIYVCYFNLHLSIFMCAMTEFQEMIFCILHIFDRLNTFS